MLSLLASLFDPLGLISPVMVSMKVLFQEICSDKLDWDETLTDEILEKWSKWVKDLLRTGEIKIGRCLYEAREGCVTECYLHGFGDASKKAYCTMVYFVYRTDGAGSCEIGGNQNKSCPLTCFAAEGRRTLVAWPMMVDRTKRRVTSKNGELSDPRKFVGSEENHNGTGGRDKVWGGHHSSGTLE